MKQRIIEKTDKVLQQEMREYFERKFNRKLSDEELLEIRDSLFYLGRAIYRYRTKVPILE